LAVVVDLFSRPMVGWLLERERVRRQIYPTRDEARANVFNYPEMFYNPKRRHVLPEIPPR
jgi:hypothetical protein